MVVPRGMSFIRYEERNGGASIADVGIVVGKVNTTESENY